jgi:hypothetical protein
LPLGSAVSSKVTLSSAEWTITAASIRSIEPARSAAWKSLRAEAAPSSVPYVAAKTSIVLLLIASPPRDVRSLPAYPTPYLAA